MQKIIFITFIFTHMLILVLGYPTDNIVRDKDLDTAETFWNVLSTGGGGRGYSGWGTGIQYQGVQPSVGYAAYGVGSYNDGYGGYASYPTYGNYGPYGVNNYGYGKVPLYTGYVSQQPTYENYGLHGGHGFGKYGKY